ncbi:MAG: hypothetical protein DMF86_22875, partial [Acidobacteria bacterium]
MICKGLAAALIAAGAALAAATAGQPAAPAVTPGAVALLLTRSDPAIIGTLRAALLQRDPSVRVVAARAAAVLPGAELVNDLIGALAREQDDHVATELTRDLLLLGGVSAIAVVEPQVRRRGGGTALAFGQWLARMQPQRFIQLLPDLTELDGAGADGLADIVAMASWQHDDLRDELFRRWMSIAPERGWRALLDQTFGPPVD